MGKIKGALFCQIPFGIKAFCVASPEKRKEMVRAWKEMNKATPFDPAVAADAIADSLGCPPNLKARYVSAMLKAYRRRKSWVDSHH